MAPLRARYRGQEEFPNLQPQPEREREQEQEQALNQQRQPRLKPEQEQEQVPSPVPQPELQQRGDREEGQPDRALSTAARQRRLRHRSQRGQRRVTKRRHQERSSRCLQTGC